MLVEYPLHGLPCLSAVFTSVQGNVNISLQIPSGFPTGIVDGQERSGFRGDQSWNATGMYAKGNARTQSFFERALNGICLSVDCNFRAVDQHPML